MIYLTGADVLESTRPVEMLDAVEEAMRVYERGDFFMPQRVHAEHDGDVLLLMPCFIGDYFATKLVSLFYDNPARGVPVLNGIVVLNDGQTGAPVALLDGPTLTAFRTAAVTGVSIRYLAPDDSRTLGIVGAGAQAFQQVRLACAARKFEEVYVFDNVAQKAAGLIEKLSRVLDGVQMHEAKSVEGLLEQSQVVITATTATEPVLPNDRVFLEGKHIAAIGSYQPHVRELPEVLYELVDSVYIDTNDAMDESGDIITPLEEGWIIREQIETLARFLMSEEPQSRREGETTLFKSVGMALFDVCAAKVVYENALRQKLGQDIKT